MIRTDSEWDELDRQIAAFMRQRAIERDVRRRLKLRQFKRDVLPLLVCSAGVVASLVWLAWTIWG